MDDYSSEEATETPAVVLPAAGITLALMQSPVLSTLELSVTQKRDAGQVVARMKAVLENNTMTQLDLLKGAHALNSVAFSADR